MIQVGNDVYVFDLNKIYNFTVHSDKSELKETELLETYENDEVSQRTIRELTTPGNSQIDNIKYDLIKTFFFQIISYDGEDVDNIEDLPFGMQIAINTMINEGFLIAAVV